MVIVLSALSYYFVTSEKNYLPRIDVQNLSQNGFSIWVANATKLSLTPTAIALGKFDGIHLGHQKVIQPILEGQNREITDKIYSTVVTFDPHPQQFFSGQPHNLLTPLEEKVEQLCSLKVKQLVLLPFDKELSALTPTEFVEKILIQQLKAVRISVGQDFRFGSCRLGAAEDLQIIAAKYNIPVHIVPLAGDEENSPISSTTIRQALNQGDIIKANQLLGRKYTLVGTVVEGEKLGTNIGFPTANLELPSDKFLPKKGVYAVHVSITSSTEENVLKSDYRGVMNIGICPTVNGTQVSVEVHLLDWSGDLYGERLLVKIEKFLRSEQKFNSLKALTNQIRCDCDTANSFFQSRC
ncbi:Riboflavin kinase [Richelia intracellularis HH01]|uniref:Riboflavin biosynthesis protein n=1 Tax=Richelia intracellularis HH01 TaxID=1165094 RepID=M1WZ51_9NOST|nr:Riboflavin kinase [Richelia intracellularis HH01]